MTSTTLTSGYTPSRNPAAMIGAVGIPAGIGAFLIAGLAVTVVIEGKTENPDTIFYEDPDVTIPPPPSPDKPEQVADRPVTDAPTPPMSDPVIPDIAINLGTSNPIEVGGLPDIPVDPIVVPSVGGGTTTPITPMFDPVAASPSNDPARWITDRDYRSSWIRREMAGTARFSLDVNASGRVVDCMITRSTSHAALDNATCALIIKRARFEPARDNTGKPVDGVYTSSVRWRLPN